MPTLPPALFRRDRPHCARGCNRCQDRCPVGIHPEPDDLRAGECLACGRCQAGCPVADVTVAGLGVRWQVVRVVVEAVALLVLAVLFA